MLYLIPLYLILIYLILPDIIPDIITYNSFPFLVIPLSVMLDSSLLSYLIPDSNLFLCYT